MENERKEIMVRDRYFYNKKWFHCHHRITVIVHMEEKEGWPGEGWGEHKQGVGNTPIWTEIEIMGVISWTMRKLMRIDNYNGNLIRINTEGNNSLIVDRVYKYLANVTVESSPGNTSNQLYHLVWPVILDPAQWHSLAELLRAWMMPPKKIIKNTGSIKIDIKGILEQDLIR